MARAVKRSKKRRETSDFSEARRARPLSPEYILFLRKRLAEQRESSQAALEISDKNLNGTDQDQATLVSGIDIQGKLSSDVVTSTSKPQTPSSRELEINQSDKSLKGYEQVQTTLVSGIEVLIEHIKKKDNEIELLKADNADIRAELQQNRTITESIMEKLKHHFEVNF